MTMRCEPAAGRGQHRAVLRPLLAGVDHAEDRLPQPAGRCGTGVPGAVAVPVQRPRRADRGGDDAAGAAVDLPRPAPVGRAGQPAVVGRDGLRHHHRWRGDRDRAHRLAIVEAATHG
uniref:Uncharacterized protein n=1 Tax=Panagrolaimus superbus TaxID=310955 RepID=A0A914ZAX1_9BILA